MGNRICRARRNTVEERYTKPQRLVVQPSNVDYKKLRKLILSEKLAPCFDGVEDSDSNSDLEECPICFYFYPSLNRSRCCTKGICTECFLQMKPSNSVRPAQCPFCKTSSYAVEYRGARTQEEKGLELAEEQKVIEAKTRMLFQESQNINQVTSANQNLSPVEVPYPMSGSRELSSGEMQEVRNSDLTLVGSSIDFAGSPALNAWNERHAEFGLDLEEIMLMEAIWQSIQGTNLQKSTAHQSSGSNGTLGSESETYMSNQHVSSLELIGQQEFPSLNLVTGGVAIAIARMAERNILQAGTFHSNHGNDQLIQTQDENSIENQSYMLSSIPHGANMLEMGPIGDAEDTEFDEASLENDCLASASTSEDDSWDSLSACILEGNQSSEDGFISDEDLVMDEAIDIASSCSSSVHTISDLSCGSPSCSDIYGGRSFSQVTNLSS